MPTTTDLPRALQYIFGPSRQVSWAWMEDLLEWRPLLRLLSSHYILWRRGRSMWETVVCSRTLSLLGGSLYTTPTRQQRQGDGSILVSLAVLVSEYLQVFRGNVSAATASDRLWASGVGARTSCSTQ